MNSRTQTVPNHIDQHRDVRWGWDAIGVITAIVGLLVAIAGGGLAAWITLSNQVAANRAEQLMDRTNLASAVRLAIAENDKASGYVTRQEWTQHNADVAEALKTTQAENRRLLQFLVEGDRYNRRVLSMIDLTGAKKDDR